MRCPQPWIVVVTLAAVALPAVARAQAPAPAAAFDPRRALVFESQQKSAWAALAIELFPGGGSLYADDTRGALATWGLIAGGAALMAIGATQLGGGEGPSYRPEGPAAAPLVITGLLVVVAGRGYGFANAYQATLRYNADLRARIGLAPEPTSPSWGR
jgi:hypothetical protein